MATTNDKKAAKNFRKLIRNLFELGEHRVEMGPHGGGLKVVADFGGHRVLLGGYGPDELDALLMLIMRTRAATPGGHKSPAMVSAFKSMMVEPAAEAAALVRAEAEP